MMRSQGICSSVSWWDTMCGLWSDLIIISFLLIFNRISLDFDLNPCKNLRVSLNQTNSFCLIRFIYFCLYHCDAFPRTRSIIYTVYIDFIDLHKYPFKNEGPLGGLRFLFFLVLPDDINNDTASSKTKARR